MYLQEARPLFATAPSNGPVVHSNSNRSPLTDVTMTSCQRVNSQKEPDCWQPTAVRTTRAAPHVQKDPRSLLGLRVAYPTQATRHIFRATSLGGMRSFPVGAHERQLRGQIDKSGTGATAELRQVSPWRFVPGGDV